MANRDSVLANELECLRDEMLEKLDEMVDLLREADSEMTYNRATSYWIPHIRMALTKDHDSLGDWPAYCEDTINELRDE